MKTKKSFFKIILCLAGMQFFFTDFLSGQDTIYLKNPSFEDIPRAGTVMTPPIKEWSDCGHINFPGESPPDIHSIASHSWGVSKAARDGTTYLSMVTRYTDTYESVSQVLTAPIEAGKCYKISGYLALSEKYESATPRSVPVPILNGKIKGSSQSLESFSNPVELLIWGGDKFCSRKQLLVHSGPVSNHDWEIFTLEFSPKENYEYITIGAFFEYGYTSPYNGHILVDGLSPVIEIECK